MAELLEGGVLLSFWADRRSVSRADCGVVPCGAAASVHRALHAARSDPVPRTPWRPLACNRTALSLFRSDLCRPCVGRIGGTTQLMVDGFSTKIARSHRAKADEKSCPLLDHGGSRRHLTVRPGKTAEQHASGNRIPEQAASRRGHRRPTGG